MRLNCFLLGSAFLRYQCGICDAVNIINMEKSIGMTITYLNIRQLTSLHKNLTGVMGQAAVACKWKDTKFYEIHQLICMLLRDCISIRNMAIQDCCHYYEILNMYSVASYLVSYINLILECSALGLVSMHV